MTDTNKGKFQQNVHFNAITPEGMLVECETLFTFENAETNRSYIVYTDNRTDDEGNTTVYASIYDPASVEYNEGAGWPPSPLSLSSPKKNGQLLSSFSKKLPNSLLRQEILNYPLRN